jgi:hypothetical protein
MTNIISGIIGALATLIAAWTNPGDWTSYILGKKTKMINISYEDIENGKSVMYKWRAEKL